MNHDYYNYYPDNSPDPNQGWNHWNNNYPPQQSSYVQNYNRPPYNHNHSMNNGRSPNYHKPQQAVNNNRPYFRPDNNASRYPKASNPYNGPRQPQAQSQYKRNRTESNTGTEAQGKPGKKRKKPLSQNPPRNNWTIAEAKWALIMEKELNKKSKSSLIIKFPDQELNKEIVTQFHGAIDNVHFQQPCTPRFCYVTLQDSANADIVIKEINQQKFGNGYLNAEYKRDREEDVVVNAEDIDPLTLYVGNLAQEVTKEDIQTMFPKCKRMDIGFAKKMKFTRYAFIGFHSVTDAVAAFRRTHNQELYNKSIIVRFRRLHGTVGLPGESKSQNLAKQKDEVPHTIKPTELALPPKRVESSGSSLVDILDMTLAAQKLPQNTSKEGFNGTNLLQETGGVKVEQPSHTEFDGDDDDFDYYLPSSPNNMFDNQEFEREEKVRIKLENQTNNCPSNSGPVKTELSENHGGDNFTVKAEPEDDYDLSDLDYQFDEEEEYYDEDDRNNTPSSGTDFDGLYETMVRSAQQLRTLKKGNF